MLYAQGYDLGSTPAHQLSIVDMDLLNDSNYLTLTYQLRSDLGGATVTPEVSRDLQTWSPDVVVVSEEQNADGTRTIRVRDSQPVTGGEERYIRIRIDE